MDNYIFYRLYLNDFILVLNSIKILKRYRKKDIRYCLLREIAVSYARPFSGNRGNKTKNHKLSEKMIPGNRKGLHEELLRLRDQQFAHTDSTYYNPKIANWSSVEKKWFPMSFRGFDFASLDKRLKEINLLTIAVKENLERKISEIESNF